VDVALHDRPALKEVFGVLVACAILLALLAKMDNEAAREYTARAEKALAAQAAHPQPKPHPTTTAKVAEVEARTESLGGRGPISIPVGAAWTAGTSAAVTRAEAPKLEPPTLPAEPLRRIIGPTPAGAVSERVPAAVTRPKQFTWTAAAPAQAPADHQWSGALMMLMMSGLLIAAAGGVILARAR
jgi:hypothetical protein